jgi:hypothetical protein
VPPAPGSAARPIMARDVDGLRVSLTVERHWWQSVVYVVLLLAWSIGEMAFAGVLLSKELITVDDLFFVAWLVGWTVAGYFLWGKWLWQMWGRREILVGARTLTLRSTVLGQSRSRAFDLPRIKKVRAVAARHGITFEYDGRTYEFGGSLDHATQQELIAAVLHRKAST